MDLAIFDLDGTLLDSLDDLADSMNEALASLGLPTHPVEKYRYFVGEGIHHLATQVMPECQRDEASIARTLERYQAAYERNWNRKSKPYEGIPDLLTRMAALRIPLAVLSNKPQHFTELCMGHFFRAGEFQVVLGQREGVPRKPSPAGALEISAKLGVAPARTLFIGDTKIDMLTGLAAGMRCAGVAWGFRPEAELRENGAHHICHAPGQILSFFQ